ncbi:solute carrier family 2, facilitated glucose transporter member 10 isoform X1 [Betta splendens]|uniref:Solute carrier family 2, facilitated glucose transporter member 10 n=1 Tax=Betta splendens TaxID=158456 RepID=A0A6P7MHE3_BETSP|nr:solute carrier family 2, facilitated glucose transporter member 10 isoform X1 [Betta splendens]
MIPSAAYDNVRDTVPELRYLKVNSTKAMGCSILQLASVVSGLGGVVFGYELGIISGALLQLKAEFRLTCVQQEALVSSLLIGALLASIVGGWLIDRHGRRNSILLSNMLILSGSLVLLISSYPALVVGRTTVGFAMCISSMSCCIFVSEVVTPDRRGFLVTLYEAGITVGILAAYAINYILFNYSRGWKWMFGLNVVPALVQLVSIWSLPSDTEKTSNNGCCQAERNLMSSIDIRESDDFKDEWKVKYHSTYLFQSKHNMKTRTTIGLGLVLFQQFTGQPNVLFYASTIFHSVGFQSSTSAVLASVGLGLVKVVATLTAMVFSDRLGRRPLLITGCSVMAVCLITAGLLSGHSMMNEKKPCSEDFHISSTALPHSTAANQSAFDNTTTEKIYTHDRIIMFDLVTQRTMDPSATVSGSAVNWLILGCMMAVVSAYAIGLGPMTWLLLSEIFPAAVRGRAFAFTSCFNWTANLLVTFTFLNMIEWIGLSGVFILYGMTAVVAVLFFYFMLPETKGKSLQEIDDELRLNRRQCCGCFSLSKPSAQYHRVQWHVSAE